MPTISGGWRYTWSRGIAAKAGPGEVLTSAATVGLLEGADLSFTDKGEYELKGVEGRRRLYALAGDGASAG